MNAITPGKGLHRLLYSSAFSRNFPRVETEQDEEIAKIIRASTRNNQARAITGLLLVAPDGFLQVLEGPAQAVMTTYGRIIADPRHQVATVISAGPANERRFGDWNMCARRLSKADNAILATLDVKGGLDLASLTPAAALKLLFAVAGIQARTAVERPAVP
jgi:hypothetical protein